MRLALWKTWMPLCFATNHGYYGRYGTDYIKFLENIENTQPGAVEKIREKGLFVRRSDIGIGQAVDLAGEQTYMRSAKTAGKVFCLYVYIHHSNIEGQKIKDIQHSVSFDTVKRTGVFLVSDLNPLFF